MTRLAPRSLEGQPLDQAWIQAGPSLKVCASVQTYQVWALVEVLIASLDSRYTKAGFNMIFVLVC